MLVAEDMGDLENNRRFQVGRASGRFDKGADLDSDMPWLTTVRERKHNDKLQDIAFDEIDPIYVKGYELGYEEGPQEEDNKKKRKP